MTLRNHRPLSAVLAGLAAASLLAMSVPASSATSRVRAARHGVRYLIGRQHANGSFSGFSPLGSTADGALAMAMARRGSSQMNEALRYLADHVAEATLGQKAKIVLAAVAGGKDLSSYAGGDLVAQLEASQEPDGQYAADGDFSAVTTHALVALALAAAGQPINDAAADWLARAQCPDGGWQFDAPYQPSEDEHCYDSSMDAEGNPVDFSTSDSNTTSYAVQALETHDHAVALDADPFDYFPLTKDETRGGYRYSHEATQFGSASYTDANSTALVIQAYLAADVADYAPPVDALEGLQYARCGELQGAFAFTWQKVDRRFKRVPSRAEAKAEDDNDGSTVVGATIGAIPALMLKPLPVGPQDPRDGAPQRHSCA